MDLDQLRARRLISQRLAPSAALETISSPAELVRWMVAIHAEQYHSGLRAVGVRCGVDDSEVIEALNNKQITRGWSPRGTLHFLAAPDARWIMRTCGGRAEAMSQGERGQLGLTLDIIKEARKVLHDKLEQAGSAVTRSEIYQAFETHDIPASDGRGEFLLKVLGSEGEVCQWSRLGDEDSFILVDELGPQEEPDAPMMEMARRYIHAYGPVEAKDFSWWSGIDAAKAHGAFVVLGAEDEDIIEDDGYLMGRWQQDVTEEELNEALALELELPAFDNYLTGYEAASFALPADLRDEVLDINGNGWAFTVENGQVTG